MHRGRHISFQWHIDRRYSRKTGGGSAPTLLLIATISPSIQLEVIENSHHNACRKVCIWQGSWLIANWRRFRQHVCHMVSLPQVLTLVQLRLEALYVEQGFLAVYFDMATVHFSRATLLRSQDVRKIIWIVSRLEAKWLKYPLWCWNSDRNREVGPTDCRLCAAANFCGSSYDVLFPTADSIVLPVCKAVMNIKAMHKYCSRVCLKVQTPFILGTYAKQVRKVPIEIVESIRSSIYLSTRLSLERHIMILVIVWQKTYTSHLSDWSLNWRQTLFCGGRTWGKRKICRSKHSRSRLLVHIALDEDRLWLSVSLLLKHECSASCVKCWNANL